MDRINVLDVIKSDWQALSVQYTYGRNAYALFSKNSIDEFSFRAKIQQEYDDVTIRKVDIFDEEFRKENFYYNDRTLGQLLLNSLKTPRNKALKYNNLTGKLLYTDPEWILRDKDSGKPFMLYALEIHLSPGMYLTLNVKTFREKKSDYGVWRREYIFDPMTKHLRRRLKNDDDSQQIFVEASFKDKRNTVDYLDISSIQRFKKCKLGILQTLLTEIKSELGEYISFEPEYKENTYSFELPPKQQGSWNNKGLVSLIKRPICIIDEVNSELSTLMADQIKSQLLTYYNINVIGTTWDERAYHIRLINDEEYYSERNIPDPHRIVPNNMIVQHMIVTNELETRKKAESPEITKVIQELLIKEDVITKQVRIFDWSSLAFDTTWKFVNRTKIRDSENSDKKSHILNALVAKPHNTVI
ncbi:MAG: hypothetical protein IK999_13050 [Ruminococcus sp.]|nr:hypothetical protein [Ruminococcus sp.]